MPTPKETSAIRAIFDAATMLSNDYATVGGATNRRDTLQRFMSAIVGSASDLAAAYDPELIDASYMRSDIELVSQSVEVAFMEAVEAEEAAEPRIDTRQYSTLRVVGGSVQ